MTDNVIGDLNAGKIPYDKKAKPITQHDKLKAYLLNFLKYSENQDWNDEWNVDIPKKWKICQNELLILPSNCFQMSHWPMNNKNFLAGLAECFKVKRVAQENRVKSDDFRSPNLTLLHGNDSIVKVVNNGIIYSYDIMKCMFSWGNITEKLRISSFDCSDEIVVDLFAGIGYFTLVYLVKANAKRVIACEWNPASVEALRNNLVLNNCEDRCEILEGDNRVTCPTNCADRVNLGLIPSSEASWKTACNALKIETGGFLHIHGNVDINKNEKLNKPDKYKSDWIIWANKTCEKIKELFETRHDNSSSWTISIEHIEYVKSYGPRVDHLVLDLLCKPNKAVSN